MEETQMHNGSKDSLPPDAIWWQSDIMEKLQSMSLSPEETSKYKESQSELQLEGLAARRASQTLWSTGKLSDQIPDGFYYVVPERRFKELFDVIPSLEELYSLDSEGLRLNVIVVNMHKDKKVSMLQQLALTLVKGLSSNPAAVIKKIARLVSDFYKGPNMDLSSVKGTLEEVYHAFDNQGIQMLGQIKHGSCSPRAILFKILADTVGLDSRLMVGLPREGVMERTDSHKHMSVIVELNSVDLLVDLVRYPGQLISFSTKAIFMTHALVTGESDSAENDSCDSPLEPNSPVCGSSDQVDVEGLSYSEPYVANAFWGRSKKNVIAEQSAAISSPEHPLLRGHGRSILGRHRALFGEYRKDMTASRSAGASPVASHRRRRRCISMIPEIGDDIVRVVRAINESMKQNNLPREQVDEHSSDHQENVLDCHLDDEDGISVVEAKANCHHRRQISCPKAISLPSSPRHSRFQASDRSEARKFAGGADMISTWNKVLESSTILSKPLFPFQEWNIDFSELTVGSRVGIGFFGEVFRGTWNGAEVAIKVLLEQELTVENIEDFCNEISILSRLRHPNVVLFLGACTTPPRLSMVTEYMDMGSLYYLIHASGLKKRISWRRRLKVLCDICRGLMCIHRMKIAHRDLKSANCLVNKHWTVKICDFGLSRVLTTSPMRDSSSAGTPEWMAPELIRNEPFTEKCDIFSLGVIIWELCTLCRPWEGVPSVQVVYAVANDGLRLEIPEGPLGKLIADCWAEPDQRPSCEEVLTRLVDCEYRLC